MRSKLKVHSLPFPKEFLWGAATASHQTEGGNHNDWTEWEKDNAKVLAANSVKKFSQISPVWSDIKNQAQDPKNYISGKAANHYQLYEKDLDIAKSLGLNAYRFSIEWSRIEPKEGQFDQKEINHYIKMVKAVRSRKMEPFITLWHWTMPLWVRDFGGPENEKFIYYFTRFCEVVVDKLKSDVKFWVTLNEPGVFTGEAYLTCNRPPQKRNILTALKVMGILAKTHREVYRKIHVLDPKSQVGFTNSVLFVEPFSQNPLDKLVANIDNFIRNNYFLSLTGTDHDFFAIQYYIHRKIKFPYQDKVANEKVSDLGWEIYPEGIYHCLMQLKKFNKPVCVTESGLADFQDKYRSDFIKETLYWVAKAIKDGVNVGGYFHWSLLDNFEWEQGFWPRFGLVEIDYKTQKRTIRPSARVYAKIIKENSIKL